MDPNSTKRREDYRAKRSALNLSRNRAFAASEKSLKSGNFIARLIGLVAVLAVSFVVAWGAHLYFSMHSAVDGAGGNHATSAKIANGQPVSILVLGVDQGIEGRHDQGNSDTLILATANPAKNKSTMTSIPRDTLAEIKGNPNQQNNIFRINSAYEVGGSQASVKTVSSLLNVPIDYYVEVNMKALSSLVNAVGGVDVNVPFDFSYDWCDFHKGKQHLNGRHAVAYVRMRKEDPRGDYGRQLRQRQVIQAIAQKAKSINTLANYRKLVDIFHKYVKTNLSFGDMITLAMRYRSSMDHLSSGYIQGHDAWIDGASIQVASTPVLQHNSDKLRQNLDLAKETLDNEETRQNTLNDEHNHLKWKDPNAFTNYQIFDHNSDTPQSSASSDSTSQNNQSTDQSSSSSQGIFGFFK